MIEFRIVKSFILGSMVVAVAVLWDVQIAHMAKELKLSKREVYVRVTQFIIGCILLGGGLIKLAGK